MKQYNWKQPNSTLLVESDTTDGYIRVFKNNTLIFQRTNLTPTTVELIESHFLSTVTKQEKTTPYIR